MRSRLRNRRYLANGLWFVIAFAHVLSFMFLVGQRVQIGSKLDPTIFETILAFPLVHAVNYCPGLDLFAVAVLANGVLWGWLVSRLVAITFHDPHKLKKGSGSVT